VYPVLIPAYVMQYEHEEVMLDHKKKGFSCTCVMAAYMQDVRLYHLQPCDDGADG
jgi:hypothetical protein